MRTYDAQSNEGAGDAPAQETVLVIEDDVATAALIREVLESAGYRVRHAVGDAGLAAARAVAPAVILLDVHMPGMGGPEVARHLRADPTTAGIPLICMSSTLARGGSAPPGMPHDDRLPKPFTIDALVATVARWAAP